MSTAASHGAADPAARWVVDTLERPAAMVRSWPDLTGAVVALRPRLTDPDVRVKGLAVGAFAAWRWVTGGASTSPVTREDVPEASFRDQVAECALATMVAGGVLPAPYTDGWTDLGRIVARGSEAWLVWWLWRSAPTPPLLRADATTAEVRAMVGVVGSGPQGLDGPQVSQAAFPAMPGAWLIRAPLPRS